MTPKDFNLDKAAYDVGEVCRLTGIGRNLVYDLLNSGELPSVLIGGRRIVPAPGIVKLLTQPTTSKPHRRGRKGAA